MALQDSYDSKITKLVKVHSIILDIKKSTLLSPLKQYSDKILYVTEDQTDVPLFAHPIFDKDKDVVYIDARPFSSVERDGSLKIRSEYDHELMIMRAKLELAWIEKDRNEFYFATEYSQTIFVRWLCETISHRFGLQPIQQVKLLALTGMFSIGQFFNGVDELNRDRYLQFISRAYMLDINTVLEVADTIEYGFPRDVTEYLQSIAILDISPRLVSLNAAVLYNMLSSAWFINANALQIVGLGIEYPPAFTALVYLATQYSVFKRSGIGMRVDKTNRQNNHAVFTRQLNSLVAAYDKE